MIGEAARIASMVAFRPAEKVALIAVTADTRQTVLLRLVLDAFSDDRQAEALPERDDGAIVGVGEQVTDERLIDLELIERQALQVRKRRIPRTEVVEREADALRSQYGHLGNDLLDVFHQHAFC